MFQQFYETAPKGIIKNNPLASVRQRFLYIAGSVMIALGIATIISASGIISTLPFDANLLFDGVLWLVTGAIVQVLLRTQRLNAAAYFLVTGLIFSLYITGLTDIKFVAALQAILFAAIVIPSDFVLYGVLTAVGINYVFQLMTWQQNYGGPEVLNKPLSPITVGVLLIALGLILRRFVHTAERAASESQRTADLLEVAAEIAEITTTLMEIKPMFTRAVELIRERFGYYHVQVFMIDDAHEYASLVASTGNVGRNLLAAGHKLGVGTRSVIGRVTLTGEVVIARDTDRDNRHAHNELLPNTRAEMALPIIDGTKIIGALDVQSIYPNAFTETDIKALEVLTSQLATAIRNARLFEAEAQRTEENKRLFISAEANLAEIERLNQQLTGAAWESYMLAQGEVGGITFDGQQVTPAADWTDGMIEASRRRRAYIPKDDPTLLAVPLMLRGEVIGVIEIDLGDGLRSGDTLDTVQTIAQRLALSLDRARLYEEAQTTSHRQRHINEIVARYQAAPSVEDLLQITVTELSQSLNATHASIRLSGDMQNGNGNHGANGANGSNGTNGTNGNRANDGGNGS